LEIAITWVGKVYFFYGTVSPIDVQTSSSNFFVGKTDTSTTWFIDMGLALATTLIDSWAQTPKTFLTTGMM